MKIRSYAADGRTVGEREIRIRRHPDGREYLDLGWPVQYYLDGEYGVRTWPDTGDLCIDIGGRNHGLDRGVYVSLEDVKRFVEAQDRAESDDDHSLRFDVKGIDY